MADQHEIPNSYSINSSDNLTDNLTTDFNPINALELMPHPEGGWYKRSYASTQLVKTSGGERPTATLIYFWLKAGESSAWHLVKSDEIWLWHGPGQLEIQLGGTAQQPEIEKTLLLGFPANSTANPQVIIPGGTWQRTLPSTQNVLVSCLVSPGFDFADWRLADEN